MAAGVSFPTRILIVEDEPLIAMMLEDFLDVLGKQLAGSTDNVAAALELVETDAIDAAILDVNLRGGEKSWPIAEALAARGVPFVLVTGGSHDSIIDQFQDRPTLPKPFTIEGVARALAGLA